MKEIYLISVFRSFVVYQTTYNDGHVVQVDVIIFMISMRPVKSTFLKRV